MSRIKNILAATALLAGIAAMGSAPAVQARDIGSGVCCAESDSICVHGTLNYYSKGTPGACR